MLTVEAKRWQEYRGVWRWPNFTPKEMADKITGALKLDIGFMDWLQRVRSSYGRPMVINSAYRTPEHQLAVSSSDRGAHVDGMAVDVRVYGQHASELLKVAYDNNVLGVGVAQSGALSTRYLHLDRWTTAPVGYRPNCWSYS